MLSSVAHHASKFKAAPKHFGDPDGICSLAMAEKAGIHCAAPPAALDVAPLVVSEGALQLLPR